MFLSIALFILRIFLNEGIYNDILLRKKRTFNLYSGYVVLVLSSIGKLCRK
jgi:hypothetical protein